MSSVAPSALAIRKAIRKLERVANSKASEIARAYAFLSSLLDHLEYNVFRALERYPLSKLKTSWFRPTPAYCPVTRLVGDEVYEVCVKFLPHYSLEVVFSNVVIYGTSPEYGSCVLYADNRGKLRVKCKKTNDWVLRLLGNFVEDPAGFARAVALDAYTTLLLMYRGVEIDEAVTGEQRSSSIDKDIIVDALVFVKKLYREHFGEVFFLTDDEARRVKETVEVADEAIDLAKTVAKMLQGYRGYWYGAVTHDKHILYTRVEGLRDEALIDTMVCRESDECTLYVEVYVGEGAVQYYITVYSRDPGKVREAVNVAKVTIPEKLKALSLA